MVKGGKGAGRALEGVVGKAVEPLLGVAKKRGWKAGPGTLRASRSGIKRGEEYVEDAASFPEAVQLARSRAGLGEDVPWKQELGPYADRVYSGRQSLDGTRGWRYDWDEKKGVHINWWDRSGGPKRTDWHYGAIKIPGTHDVYDSRMQHGFPQA